METTDLHSAMREAQTEDMAPSPEKELRTKIMAFRVTEREQALVKQICESNGTTQSSWLQKCVAGLIKDYGG